ncbi:MAG: O-methyltransferase [Lentisphaeria bacterium]
MTIYDDQHSEYITGLFATQDDALHRIYEETPTYGLPAISIRPEEGQFLHFLVRACGARKALEIGTLGGYSGVWIARALPPEGSLTTLELEPKHADVAQRNFELAGVSDRVQIHVCDAHDMLLTLASDGPYDFVFIDAEKTGYQRYYEWAVSNGHPGSVIVAHNAFRSGAVVRPSGADDGTDAVRDFTARVAADARVTATIYPGGDGMVVAVVASG